MVDLKIFLNHKNVKALIGGGGFADVPAWLGSIELFQGGNGEGIEGCISYVGIHFLSGACLTARAEHQTPVLCLSLADAALVPRVPAARCHPYLGLPLC